MQLHDVFKQVRAQKAVTGHCDPSAWGRSCVGGFAQRLRGR
jgi:hypothetical protein